MLTPPIPSRPVSDPSSTARLPSPVARAEHEPLDRQHAEAEHIDERVAAVTGREAELAAHGRHPHRIAIAGDAPDDAVEDPTAPGVLERAHEERVHEGDGPGAHGEDVTQDPTDPCGRPLLRLDRRRMVVALDPHGDRDAVADVDDAGVLARSDEYMGALGGQPAKVNPRRLVRAMLAPHHRIHGKFQAGSGLGPCRDDRLVLVVGQSERSVKCRLGAHGVCPIRVGEDARQSRIG